MPAHTCEVLGRDQQRRPAEQRDAGREAQLAGQEEHAVAGQGEAHEDRAVVGGLGAPVPERQGEEPVDHAHPVGEHRDALGVEQQVGRQQRLPPVEPLLDVPEHPDAVELVLARPAAADDPAVEVARKRPGGGDRQRRVGGEGDDVAQPACVATPHPRRPCADRTRPFAAVGHASAPLSALAGTVDGARRDAGGRWRSSPPDRSGPARCTPTRRHRARRASSRGCSG